MLNKPYRTLKEIVYYMKKENKDRAKVFCLGLSRTATTSLSEALEILGYRTLHFPAYWLNPLTGRIHFLNHQLKEYDAFTDISVIPFYKDFDNYFLRAKFILTTRDLDSWLNSCKKFRNFNLPVAQQPESRRVLHKIIYDTSFYEKEKFSDAYKRHELEVRKYFKGREKDLLIMNIPAGDGWEVLCDFLHKPKPTYEFPKLNAKMVSSEGRHAKRMHKLLC